MKCQEVNKLLVAYLDNEVSPSDRTLIQAHLAGCHACQQELAALSALERRVSQFMQARAAQATPSPQAWSHLQAELERPSFLERLALALSCIKQSFQLRGGVTMKRALASAVLVVLVIAAGTAAFVPAVRAQVGELLQWFRFETPAGGGEVSIPGMVGFAPLRPTYLPVGFKAMAVGLNPGAASLNYWNSATDQVLIIDQRKLSPGDERTLPAGIRVSVNGQPAVLVTDLKGSISFVSLPPTPSAPVDEPSESNQSMLQEPLSSAGETVSYTDARQLVWYVDNVRIEMLSNLPVEEMLKIAESMAPAEMDKGVGMRKWLFIGSARGRTGDLRVGLAREPSFTLVSK